jgi:hypothetical protein
VERPPRHCYKTHRVQWSPLVQKVSTPQGTTATEGPHSAAAAMKARRIIAAHAWSWLSKGHILQLADLLRALALVPCSLPALMQVCVRLRLRHGSHFLPALQPRTAARPLLPRHASSNWSSGGLPPLPPCNSLLCSLLEIKQCMHECREPDLFDLDVKLISSVDPVYTSNRKRVVVTGLLTTICVACIVTANC